MSDFDFRAINLNLIPALHALLLERAVGRAAQRVGVSQSAMSHSLAKLRQLFEDPLLVASGRGLVITPRGEQLLERLPEALEQLRGALAPPQTFCPATSSRTFRLATHDYFEFTALPDVLRYFRRHAPRVRLHVERVGASTVARLRAGEIDLLTTGVSARVPAHGLRRRVTFHDPFAVIARKGHPEIGRRLTLPVYLELDHVLVSVDGHSEGAVDRALRSGGMQRRVALRVPNFVSAPLAVLASDMISTVAQSVALQARDQFGVRVLAPPIAVPAAGVAAYWPRQHDTDSARRWFRDLFVEGHALGARMRALIRAEPRST